jgi:hypothetical protein
VTGVSLGHLVRVGAALAVPGDVEGAARRPASAPWSRLTSGERRVYVVVEPASRWRVRAAASEPSGACREPACRLRPAAGGDDGMTARTGRDRADEATVLRVVVLRGRN